MKKNRKLLVVLLIIAAMVFTTSCGVHVNFNVAEDGSETITSMQAYYSEAELIKLSTDDDGTVNEEEVQDMKDTAKTEVIDGTTYYYDIPSYYTEEEIRDNYSDWDGTVDEDAVKEALEGKEQKVLNGTTYYIFPTATASYDNRDNGNVNDESLGGYFSENSFEMPLPTATYTADESTMSMYESMFDGADFADYIYTFPYKVAAANGKISEDGYTVTYDVAGLAKEFSDRGFRLYAAFTDEAAQATDIRIKSKVSGGDTYYTVKDGTTYTTARDVEIVTDGAIASLTVNNRTIAGRTVTLTKDGDYRVFVKLASGSYKLVTFSIKQKHRITYNVNGGKALTTSYKLVRYGDEYGTLPTPKRTGYTFLGWYTKKTGGEEVTSSTVCEKKTTIYAHWQKK